MSTVLKLSYFYRIHERTSHYSKKNSNAKPPMLKLPLVSAAVSVASAAVCTRCF